MSHQDLSRRTHDTRYNRRGLLGQVGRVLTDEDVTAIGDITADEMAADRVGIIGAHGTSNDGFRVSDAWIEDGVIEFSLEAGDYWIGGERARLHEDTSFRLQPDWLTREDLPAPDGERYDLAVLELYTQPVGATEQEAAVDPALGGVDTAAHLRIMARVRLVTGLDAGACHDLWAETRIRWADAGWGELNPATHELEPDGTLTVGFTEMGEDQDLCSPDIQDGFLGAANRAIRVQMVTSDMFCWGFENGGRLMRATVDAAGTGLTLLTDPVDTAHWPAPGQVVEVLPWGAVDFNGEKIAAEAEGHFTTVDAGYDPDTGEVTLADAVPAGFNTAWQARADAADLETTRFGADEHGPYVFVRVWDRGLDRASAPAMAIGAAVPLGLTGLTVTHAGTALRPGDAWIIAARPFAPDDIAPWELRVGAAPEARRIFAAPLATIHWDGDGNANVHDCRARFQPLTRQGDCVTLRVGDGTASHGDYLSIQAAVNALPDAGGRILVLPGTYEEHVSITGARDIRIEGCGPRTRVVPATEADVVDDTPIFAIEGGTNIMLKDMAIDAPAQLAVSVTAGHGDDNQFIRSRAILLDSLQITHFQRGGIWIAAAIDATVRNCLCHVDGTLDDRALEEATHRPSIYAQGDELVIERNTLTASDFGKVLAPALGGIQIGGGSETALVRENLIEGTYGNGVTLGSVVYVPVQQLDDPDRLTAYFAQAYGTILQAWTFTVTDDNCFGLDPVPPARDPDDNGTEWVPVPDGALADIRIEDNRIRDMGGNGIGVVQYFNLDTDPFLISVEDLAIIGNEITGVLSGENRPFPAEMQLVAAWAGIALADIARTEIRENRIVGNARRHDLPAVGIFALYAEDTEIVENTIADTGRRLDEVDGDGAGGGGWRGGIAITQVRPNPQSGGNPYDLDGPIRSDGSSALVVHGNSVRAPQGRALLAFGIGPMQATDNRLVTQSGASNGWILALFNMRRLGQFSLGGLLVNSLFVAVAEGQRPNSSAGHLILSIMGGDVVAMANMGVSNEIYLQNTGLSDTLIGGDQELGFDTPGDLKVGGDIMLNDNQIRLDGMDGQSSAGISAVALASLDSVMVNDNQISLDLDADFMGVNLLAIGWSVHASSNRLKEPLANCFVSALTWGLMNTTAMNQASHCVLAFGPAATLMDAGNTELIETIWGAMTGSDNRGELCAQMREGLTGGLTNDLMAVQGYTSMLGQFSGRPDGLAKTGVGR
ncbi:right-handed parallel beta-helix repeat-containing protein [Chachezhania antarctica]|uniref:right-handed parallel beta-helix repeat-containing protein n=1 Tax=Chachezhania antarctica TaxID=2340860 RepID=UPI000EAF8487|nr:right-handed parallel beta-helix repeat-containing protein [Chachezhania antarctica]